MFVGWFTERPEMACVVREEVPPVEAERAVGFVPFKKEASRGRGRGRGGGGGRGGKKKSDPLKKFGR